MRVRGPRGDVGAVARDGGHHVIDGGRRASCVRWVDDSEHTLLAMGGYTAVEERRVRRVNDLGEDKALVLDTGGEWCIGSLVAKLELGGFGNSMHVGVPLELDGITDGGIHRERDISENTLSWGNDDSVSYTVSRRGVGAVSRSRWCVCSSGSTERCNTF